MIGESLGLKTHRHLELYTKLNSLPKHIELFKDQLLEYVLHTLLIYMTMKCINRPDKLHWTFHMKGDFDKPETLLERFDRTLRISMR